jgi:hypothetical protein
MQSKKMEQHHPRTHAEVNVVLLAGDFNQDLVQEIIQKCITDTLCKDSSSTLLRKTVVRLKLCFFASLEA